MTTFPGYPLPTEFDDNTPNLTTQAAAHNEERVAINDLQVQISVLEAAVGSAQDTADAVMAALSVFSDPVEYTPTLYNVTVGAGGYAWGKYISIGDLVLLQMGFKLGTGFTMSSGHFSIGLPPGLDAVVVGNRYPVFSAWVNSASDSRRWSGTGIIAESELNRVGRFASDNIQIGWDNTHPVTFEVNDMIAASGHYWRS